MKKGMPWRGLLLMLILCLMVSPAMALAEAETEAEEETALPVFAWKTYEMTVPYASADLEAYGISDFQGNMAVVRICAVEGKIKYNDFYQNLFKLADAEGNLVDCKFFVMPNKDKIITGASMPSAQQDYIDLLFPLEEPTEETLREMFLAVYEEKEGEPVLVPLLGVPSVKPE